MKVFCYRNLHKEGNVYSIKSLEGPTKGRIVGYAHGIYLEDCKLIVSEAGRQRVLKEKRKNVHAGIVGTLVSVCGYQTRIHIAELAKELTHFNDESWLKNFKSGTAVTYNPFLYSSFVIRGSNTSIYKAKKITFFHSRVEALEI